MQKIKCAYYYLFYKLYKFWDYVSYPKFATAWKAGLSIIILEIWLYFSCINYYTFLTNTKIHLSFFNPIVFFPFVLILAIDYIAFIHYEDVWKKYNEEFDNIPKIKNVIGSIIVWSIIISVIVIHFFII